MSDILEKIWGKEFAEKYRQALAKAQAVPQEKLEAIKRFAIDKIRESLDFHVKYDDLDIILVQTASDPTKFPVVKTSAGNYKVGMIWAGSKSMRGPFISVFTADVDIANKLAAIANKPFLLVGKLQEREFAGDKTYSFRLMGVIEIE